MISRNISFNLFQNQNDTDAKAQRAEVCFLFRKYIILMLSRFIAHNSYYFVHSEENSPDRQHFYSNMKYLCRM